MAFGKKKDAATEPAPEQAPEHAPEQAPEQTPEAAESTPTPARQPRRIRGSVDDEWA